MSSAKTDTFPRVYAFFVGGVGDDVTGSATLIKITGKDGKDRYGMIDAGATQGKSEYLRYEYPISGENISFIILTHAHFDHIGMLPLLYKRGFRGKIYCTGTVKSIAYPLLLDSAKIIASKNTMHESAKRAIEGVEHRLAGERLLTTKYQDMKSYDPAISQIDEMQPELLYTVEDVEEVWKLFVPIEPYRKNSIATGISFKLLPTNHQNGASRVELYIGEDNNSCNIAFSGDIGPSGSLLYRNDADLYNENIDYLVLESLHGVEEPSESIKTSIKRLFEIIKRGAKQGKHIVLAGFSLDRNAMLVYLMNILKKQGIDVEIYIDSPLTMWMLSIYTSTYKKDAHYFKDLGEAPFDLKDMHVVSKGRQHVDSVLHGEGPRVIITASANGTGGNILDYFEQGIQREDYAFVFCGWLNPNSPSSILHEAQTGKICEIGNQRYVKKCKTYRIYGFSSHGYYPEMLATINDYPNLRGLILNHADYDEKLKLQNKLKSIYGEEIYIPLRYDGYALEKDKIRPMDTQETELEFGTIMVE